MIVELLAGAFIAAAVAAATSHGYVRKRALRVLHATPRLSPASSVGATVVAIGRVRPLAPELDAPLSGRPCVAFRARVYRGSVDAMFWERAAVVGFALDREDGPSIVIEATHAAFMFPPLPLPVDAPDRCDQFAIELGLAASLRKKGTYEEVLVLEDMRVAICGRLVENGEHPRLGGDAESPIVIAVPF